MKKSKIQLYTDISGNEIGTSRYDFGSGDKKIYIQGGVHGGEVTYFIFNKLYDYLSKNEAKLNGIVTLVPVVNPIAWNQRVYYYTVGKFDLYKGKDWNRSYPGNEKGTLSQRNSKAIYDIASKYEVVIDLHTARVSKPYGIYFGEEDVDLVIKMGLEYNFYVESNQKFDGTLNSALIGSKVKSIAVECGSHDNYDADAVDEVYNGLLNIIKNEALKEQKQNIFTKPLTIYAEKSGFAKYNFQPREEFKRGDVLCTIQPSETLGEEIEVRAEFDGIMSELAKSNVCWEGDELVKVIKSTDLRSI